MDKETKYYECKKCPHNCTTWIENSKCIPKYLDGRDVSPEWELTTEENIEIKRSIDINIPGAKTAIDAGLELLKLL